MNKSYPNTRNDCQPIGDAQDSHGLNQMRLTA